MRVLRNKYINCGIAIDVDRLFGATSALSLYVNALRLLGSLWPKITLAHHMMLIVVVIVQAMITHSCPVVEHIAWLQLLLTIAISPASVAGTDHICGPGLIAQIVHLFVELAVKGEQRNTWFVGYGNLKAPWSVHLDPGLRHIVGMAGDYKEAKNSDQLGRDLRR